MPADIASALQVAGARLGLFSRPFIWYDEIGSTNDAAARLAERNSPEGTVVAADAQVAGRGRVGRVWVSPPGAGLYVSVVLRPPEAVLSLLTIGAGVAIADGIHTATGLRPGLKWPNDVYVNRRKLAGILAEGGGSVVLGFGINVRPAAYPADVARLATSLEGELGRPVDRGLVLAECLAALAVRYEQLTQGRGDVVLADWRSRAAEMLGGAVEWDGGRGIAHDIDADGALLVRTAGGIERIVSGEVRWSGLIR